MRVASYLRMPPAVLETCHESRREAKKCYTMVNLGRGLNLEEQGHTYFNPGSDIVYFGLNSCIATLLHFCFYGARRINSGDKVTAAFDVGQQGTHISVSDANDDRIDTPRVALRMKPKKGRSRLEGEHKNRGKCCTATWYSYAYNIDGPYDELHLLKVLHGRNPISSSEPEYDDNYEYPGIPYEGCNGLPGCRGLEKVYFVVEPRASDIDPDVVDECIGLRTIDHYVAPSAHAHDDMDEVELIIADVDHEEALEGVGSNRWSGDKKPSFEFMEFSTRATSAKAHKVVFLRINSEETFYYVFTQVQHVKDCKIGIYPAYWQGDGDYAFSFHGRTERVETGIWILERLQLGDGVTAVREIDELDAEFPVEREINEHWGKDESLYKGIEIARECSLWSID